MTTTAAVYIFLVWPVNNTNISCGWGKKKSTNWCWFLSHTQGPCQKYSLALSVILCIVLFLKLQPALWATPCFDRAQPSSRRAIVIIHDVGYVDASPQPLTDCCLMFLILWLLRTTHPPPKNVPVDCALPSATRMQRLTLMGSAVVEKNQGTDRDSSIYSLIYSCFGI